MNVRALLAFAYHSASYQIAARERRAQGRQLPVRREQVQVRLSPHPKGFGERVRLTRAYLARKEAGYEALQAEIKALRQEMPAPERPT